MRWVAVHHGDNHIHIVATLARQDGRRASLRQRATTGSARRCATSRPSTACGWWSGPTGPPRGGRPGPSRRRRPGPGRPSRPGSRCGGTWPRPRPRPGPSRSSSPTWPPRACGSGCGTATHNPGEVTGYAVTLDGDVTAAGEPVWFGGGKLAPDLTLPKLRRRWPEPGRAGGPPARWAGRRAGPRLHGHGMTARSARAALRREVARCAAAARSEPEFFAGLDAAGLLVRLRHGPTGPARVAGYAVSLPA